MSERVSSHRACQVAVGHSAGWGPVHLDLVSGRFPNSGDQIAFQIHFIRMVCLPSEWLNTVFFGWDVDPY